MDFKFFFAVFVFSLFVSLPIATAQDLATGYATRTYDVIKPALPKTITENVLAPAGTPVYEMRIDVSNTVVQARITIESTDAEKAALQVLPGGIIYSYINITTKNIDDLDLEDFTMKFRVPKSWLSENNVDAGNVKMLRFTPDVWDELTTVNISEDADFVAYQADSPGFSIFAITGESATPLPEVEEKIGEQPEITEVTPGEDVMSKKSQENLTSVVIVIIVVIIVAALFLLPHSFMRRKLRR